MPERVLTLRDLNRAMLTRQMLLAREAIPVPEAVERLVGLQAQVPNPPYIGLWTRLQEFRRDELTRAMEKRQIVRAAMMRSTLHLVTATDHQRFRPTLQPALARALNAFFGKRAQGLDSALLVEAARAALEAGPLTTGALRARLLEVAPDRDADALAYAVRTHLPLVQVPPGGTWGSGSGATYAIADEWLGEPASTTNNLALLIRRYLAAFGPATVMDFQAWSGLTGLKPAWAALRPELRPLRDDQGRELLDLPDAPLPPADTPAPPRFVPEYDNLLLSHADRTRIIADAHRPRVFLSAGRVRATFLVDGFVAGTWKIERAKKTATLVIEPFDTLSKQAREALADEGERLARFVEEAADESRVRFADNPEMAR